MTKKELTKKEIIKKAKELGVEFIDLQFTDIFGIMKNVTITIDQLEKALNNEIMFDGSSIDGFVRIEESDMYLRPDYETFQVLPWSKHPKEARLICDVYKPDGTPFEGDPRYILKKVIAEAKEMGYVFNVGPECEFFLFNTDEKGSPSLETHDQAGYFDLAPIDLGGDARKDMTLVLKDMGFNIEASHHEVAPGQHEIDFEYEDALTTADNIMTFKMVVRIIAQHHGLHATFMPKPKYGINGSGMHINMSLAKLNNQNAFFDPKDDIKFSDTAYQFLAGVTKHAKGLAAVTNPTVNSYKRLTPGYEAPVTIAWSTSNRSPLIRIPAKRGQSTRIELRNPDPSANPYLALASILKAGLDGIKKDMKPSEAVDKNVYDLTEEEIKSLKIESLPENLNQAIMYLKKDSVIKTALGKHVTDKLIEAGLKEWRDYSKTVSQWELDTYLRKY